MSLALPDALIDSLARSPVLIFFYILLLLAFAAITNADKLRTALRRPQHWDSEQARLQANLAHWELQAYKKAHGFSDEMDPYPSSPPRNREWSAVRPLSFWERFGYASLGAYIGATPPLPQPSGAAGPDSASFLGTVLVLLATVLTVGLLVAYLGRRFSVRALLVVVGAVSVPVLATLVALAVAGIYWASGHPLRLAP